MALGDGIRRNIARVDPAERAMLRDAILEMHRRFYPGNRGETPPGGVSWWFKQDEIHQSTHVHGGPEFLPWHREVTNRFEELLRQINPQLSLHYWDFKDDPRGAPDGNGGTVNLFDPNFMGSPGIDETVNPAGGPIGDPWLSAGFYDPLAGTSNHPEDRESSGHPVDPPKFVMRPSNYPGPAPAPLITAAQENQILGLQEFGPGLAQNDSSDPNFRNIKRNFFRTAWEDIHNQAHPYFADISPHDAFRDPFVFLIHSNVDRIYAMWQTDPNHPERLSPNTVYGIESNMDVDVNAVGVQSLQNLTHQVEPWSTGTGEFTNVRPWESTHENQGFPHDYHHISVVAPPCYDTNLSTFRIDEVENPFNVGTGRFQIIFNDVPEEETTWRAAVIRIYTCLDTTFRVKPGTEPGAPFGIEVNPATAVHGAHPHAFQDVRIWFRYTAGALGTAGPTGHDDGPVNTTIQCVETGQEFQFELRAHYIHRQTIAVQMVLDQSGSMGWAAGTSGLTRLEVLKDAANLFATVIQNNNGLGIVRFDQDAYQPNDATYGGMPITRITSDADRDTAHAAINLHGAHGETSVGDGLVMGNNQILALPVLSYDQTALLVLTDGIENQPISIANAMGSVNSKVFAVGLGNEFQVNTAALTSISGSTGGNLLLSGILTAGTDDFFRLKKFFLQILAGVTNTSIVRDPIGYINAGTRIRIPFKLSEADINCRVILLTDYPVVKLSVEAPDGTVIDEGNAAGFAVKFKTSGNTKTSSYNLPIAFQAKKVQAGTWNAILEIDPVLYKRTLSVLSDKDKTAAANLRAKGARYCLSAHSFSNLRMTAAVTQNAYEPGSTLRLRATLKEYNLPVERRAGVRAELEFPDHTRGVLSLPEVQPGIFETDMVANIPGIYRFTVVAEGGTYKGVPFTREQLLTAAVFHELPNPPAPPPSETGKDDWCRLLACLLSEKNFTPKFQEWLKNEGINLDGFRGCVKAYCRPARDGGTDKEHEKIKQVEKAN